MVFFFENADINEALFENIKHIDDNGNEYWLARELQKVLEYTEWRNFCKVIEKAKKSCENSGNDVFFHFVDVNKSYKMPNGGDREVA